MKKYSKIFMFAIAVIAVATSCKKSGENLVIPPSEYHFVAPANSGTYLTNQRSSYKLAVGSTTTEAAARNVSVKVNSPSGAIEGTHYTFTRKSVTIPANAAVSPDSLEIKAVNSYYVAGRRDTLRLIIEQTGDAQSLAYLDTFTLVIRNCNDLTDITSTSILDLKGTYANTKETFNNGAPYGPYTTTISAVTVTSTTTANITVTNLWDNGWEPLNFTLDWSDPNNRKITAIANPAIAGSNAGDLSASYNGMKIAMRQFAGNLGTFSLCNRTLTLNMDLGVNNNGTVLGYFGVLYQVKLAQ